ncbi:MAG: hypothetical protein JOS17DRAFT_758537 [Linnemannia elongata]|nr:MAG: hypothetical protein JOS17DRAFT_758537 [Linnemannia elongata]
MWLNAISSLVPFIYLSKCKALTTMPDIALDSSVAFSFQTHMLGHDTLLGVSLASSTFFSYPGRQRALRHQSLVCLPPKKLVESRTSALVEVV